MNTISITTSHFLSRLVTRPRVFSVPRPPAGRPHGLPLAPRPARGENAAWFSMTDDRVSSGMAMVLFAVTLPAVGYAFHQLWQLVGGESLNHAVQAFVP